MSRVLYFLAMAPPHPRPVMLLLVLALACASDEVRAHAGASVKIAELTAAIARHPGEGDLWLARAAEYPDDGRYVAALRDIDRAHPLLPRPAAGEIVRGGTLPQIGRAAAAQA